MSKDKQPSEEFQSFEDIASKIFQVSIEEVRALEKNERQKKVNKNNPKTLDD